MRDSSHDNWASTEVCRDCSTEICGRVNPEGERIDATEHPARLSSSSDGALRLACCCAQCVDEWTGEGRLDAAAVPQDVHPVRIQPVGRYAIQIQWSDGHDAGIYPFERLRELG